MKTRTMMVLLAGAAVASGCAMMMGDAQYKARALEMMKHDFKERGQAKLDRLDQDEALAACSRSPSDGPIPKPMAERIEKTNLALVKYPSDGKFLGDWREGEKIAQSGRGKQFSDDPKLEAGGNCYACHQIAPTEVSFGTIGPSLYNFGKVRGNSPEIQRYTYGKVYNPQAYTACSNMPRFGHNQILTEEQIKHVVALLLDPASPVNK